MLFHLIEKLQNEEPDASVIYSNCENFESEFLRTAIDLHQVNGCFAELSYEKQKISMVEIENGGLDGGLNKRQESVILIIKETPGLNLKAIAEKIGIPIATLDKYLRLFVKLEIVKEEEVKKKVVIGKFENRIQHPD